MADFIRRFLIICLVLIAFVPLGIWIYVKFASDFRRLQASQLPDGSMSSKLVYIRRFDSSGRDISFWAINVSNKTASNLYACYFDLIAAGDQTRYSAYSSGYYLSDCSSWSSTRQNYECRLQNSLTRITQSDSSRQFDRFTANSIITLPVAGFYAAVTSPQDNFYAKRRLSDIYQLQVMCRSQSGHWVRALTEVTR